MNAKPEIELADYIQLVFRRKLIVVVVFGLTVLAAVLLTASQTPIYQATAQVLIKPSTSLEIAGNQTSTARADRIRDLANEVVFAKGDRVVNAVLAELDVESTITISANPDSDVMEFSARNADPATAQAWANAHAGAYVTERLAEANETYLAATSLIEDELDVVRTQLALQFDTESAARVTLAAQEARLVEALRELGLVDRLSAVGQAQITSLAATPTKAVAPNWTRNIAAAIFIAGIFGVGAALATEALDQTIRSKEQVQLATGNLPVLGSIPKPTKSRKSTEKAILPSLQLPGFLESMRSLRSSIRIVRVGGHGFNALLVTSANPSEGKSTTAANLALSFARSGVHTLVIDLDMRSPSIHTLFGLENESGITNAVLEGSTVQPMPERATGDSLVDVVTAGFNPSDPVDVASSSELEKIIQDLSFIYDMVIIDSPPVLPVSDTLALSRICDATLVVARAGQTKQKDLTEAMESLERSGAQVLGTVLTGDTAESKRYGYGYGQASFSENELSPLGSARRSRKLEGSK